MPFMPIPGGRIHYETWGDGYPVVLFGPGFLNSRIERWATNPTKPGTPQDWADPIPVLSPHFRLIGLDVRNGGESRAPIGPDYDWASYTADHIALIDHLGITRCHVMGACIGVSFAFSLAEARPGLVTGLVAQNPVGGHNNRATVMAEVEQWVAEVRNWPGVDAATLDSRCRAHVRRRFPVQRLPRIRRHLRDAGAADGRQRFDASSGNLGRYRAPGTPHRGARPMEGPAAPRRGHATRARLPDRPPATGLRVAEPGHPPNVRAASVPWRPLDRLAAGIEALVVGALALDVAVTFTSTLLRYLFRRDLPWAPDVSLILISIIAFLGGPAFFRRNRAMAYTAVLERLHGRSRQALEAFGLWGVIAVAGLTLGFYPGFFAGAGPPDVAGAWSPPAAWSPSGWASASCC